MWHGCFSSCQTYEGGIAGEPGSEAHGGYVCSLLMIRCCNCCLISIFALLPCNVTYTFVLTCNRYTFCGLATMILINEVHRLDLSALIVRLILSCYSLFQMFHLLVNKEDDLACVPWFLILRYIYKHFKKNDTFFTWTKLLASNLYDGQANHTHVGQCCRGRFV